MRKAWLVALALTAGIAAAIPLWRSAGAGDPGGPSRRWCHDLNNGELFAVPMDVATPCAAPSGDLAGKPAGTPAGVDAVVLRRPDGSDAVAYLFVTTLPDRTGAQAGQTGSTRWVREPHGTTWHSESSPEGRRITAAVMQLAAGAPITLSFPPER